MACPITLKILSRRKCQSALPIFAGQLLKSSKALPAMPCRCGRQLMKLRISPMLLATNNLTGAFVWPSRVGAGWDFKKNLVVALIDGTRALRSVDARARFIQPEPYIHYVPRWNVPPESVTGKNDSVTQVWDMMTGRICPELGGSPDILDIVGMNLYGGNVREADETTVSIGDLRHRPLHKQIGDVAARYNRLVIISESGAEAGDGPAWLRLIGGETRMAQADGIDVQGLCTYPVMHSAGWTNNRLCPTGFVTLEEGFQNPSYDKAMAEALFEQQLIMTHAHDLMEKTARLFRPTPRLVKSAAARRF